MHQKIIAHLLPTLLSLFAIPLYGNISASNEVHPDYVLVEECQNTSREASIDVDALSAHDNQLNQLIERYPPVLMRIDERPLFFECLDFNEIEVKLVNSIYDPAPYCATTAGTIFKGYWTPQTQVGIYLNKRLVKTLPLQLGKTTFTIKERNRPFRPVKGCLKGVIEVTRSELPIKVLGYSVKSREYDKKEDFLKPYFLAQADKRIVDHHFGKAPVYKMTLTVSEMIPPGIVRPYYEKGYAPLQICQ